MIKKKVILECLNCSCRFRVPFDIAISALKCPYCKSNKGFKENDEHGFSLKMNRNERLKQLGKEIRSDAMKFLERLKTCKKCGHMWVSRIPDVRQCPKCHTARWDQDHK